MKSAAGPSHKLQFSPDRTEQGSCSPACAEGEREREETPMPASYECSGGAGRADGLRVAWTTPKPCRKKERERERQKGRERGRKKERERESEGEPIFCVSAELLQSNSIHYVQICNG